MKFTTMTIAALLAATAIPAAAEDTIRAITALPVNNEMTRRFVAFTEIVNEMGEGVVNIEIVGGPEAIPGPQQDTALRNGVFDMQSGPAAYYAGTVPEVEALRGAIVAPSVARETGAFDVLEDAWRTKLDAELISWISGDVPYYVFLREDPVFDDAGALDLTGLNMRSVPTYRDWFEMLGANNVMLQQSEVFTALERGVVDGFGWIAFSGDLGVNDLIKARVGPGVWQVNAVIMMNGGSYDALSDESKDVLAAAALQLEAENVAHFAALIAEETASLEAAGVDVITLEGEAGAAHVRTAHEMLWNTLAEKSPEAAATLRPLLYPEQ